MENPQAQNELVQPQASAGDSQTVSSQPTPPTSEVPEPVIPPEKGKSETILWVGVGLLVLALVGIGVYYFVFRETTPTPSPTPVPTQAPTSTPDPTANWQIYRNEESGFLLKYPNDWHTDVSEDGTILFDNKPIDGEEVLTPEQVAITISVIADQQLIEQYIESWEIDLEHELITKVIDGVSFEYIMISENNPRELYRQSIVVRVIHEDKFYKLATNDLFKDTFDQILSTFEFTEATPSATVAP